MSYTADSDCVKFFFHAGENKPLSSLIRHNDTETQFRGCASMAEHESPLCASALNASSTRSLALRCASKAAALRSSLNRDTEKYLKPEKIKNVLNRPG